MNLFDEPICEGIGAPVLSVTVTKTLPTWTKGLPIAIKLDF